MCSRVKLAFIYSITNLIIWIVAGECVKILFTDSPARSAYALLSAWWFVLYLGYIFKAYSWPTILFMILFTMFFWDIVQILGFQVVFSYRDPFKIMTLHNLRLMLSWSIILTSPFVVNSIVVLLVSKVSSFLTRKG